MRRSRKFTVIIEPQEEGGYTVFVPALPEVVTEGDTEAEALSMAQEAIELAIEQRLSEGEPIPVGDAAELRCVVVTAEDAA